MEPLINIFLALHIIGIAALLGGFLGQVKAMKGGGARMTPGMLHGALTMLVTGLALVGLNQADDQEVNNTKIAVKLVVLLVITVLVYIKRDDERVETPVFGAVGALTVVNIFLATLW
ncbi:MULTISPECIES: hypothetical protein [unclassified Streptomyces]|uniref:Integral membrane protein n=1 Tax=Streptomyces johnsoniae TaxID=3075532 RepID=A0ABU2S5D9_9ACTN|nr:MULTISPECIES: hypothetical protein [unclassified Streptomyces]MDT0443644.1 hypothetical protein [Streptomyces sp. DSM 41886]ONK11988.1 hypothetical protein STBA_27240 [Streptomyces sp. MP131-18]